MPEKTATKTPSKTTSKQTISTQTENPLSKLQEAVENEVRKRSIINEFIASQLKENIDYGVITISGRAGKPTLFKPGMEKIFSLFGIVSRLEKDEDTLSMINSKDVIAYKCMLFREGQFISEGRGACAVSERGRVNDAIKIAEKRARMDACLNLGFSEYFTQDLEDRPAEDELSRPTPSERRQPSRSTTQMLEFTVLKKEELESQSGNPYARLTTDKGTVIAFRNTMDTFKYGSTYLSGGVWEERNGNKAFVITAAPTGAREEEALSSKDKEPAS